LKLEDLARKLLTYEIHHREEEQEISDREIGLKSIVKDPKSQGDSKTFEALEDEIIILARCFHKLLKKKSFDLKDAQIESPSKAKKMYKIHLSKA